MTIREWIRKRRARRFVLRDVATLSHEDATAIMRACARNGVGRQELLVALSARALATSPPERRYVYQKWHDVYRAGRRVRTKNYSVRLLEPVSDELARAVEDIFGEEG
jgi:hypothetical protein